MKRKELDQLELASKMHFEDFWARLLSVCRTPSEAEKLTQVKPFLQSIHDSEFNMKIAKKFMDEMQKELMQMADSENKAGFHRENI